MNLDFDHDGEQVPVEPDRVARAFAAYGSELRRFATARLRSAVAAEDVVQEAFLRLAVEADAGRFPRRPRPWLYRVVANLIISAARRSQASGSLIALEPRAATEPVDPETPETRCLSLERHRSLAVAMACIGIPARTGLIMAAEGYTGREIAMAIGRSEVATRALMFRTRAQVRRSLLLAEAV